MIVLLTLLVYFVVLMTFSRITSRRADNETFYRGNRRSPWYMVAFGMVGASISGVTFVSVPGMILSRDMTYIQTCLGFIPGYFAVAFILLPIYYRWNVTTIYTCLQKRLGERSYKTGSAFFILSKMTGAAVRFYVVCVILQRFVVDSLTPIDISVLTLHLSVGRIPFFVTVAVLAALIWLYTRRGGIKTLVWTDTLNTLCMFAALLMIIVCVCEGLGLSLYEAVAVVADDERSRVFVWDDFMSRNNFWKQFVSGAFIVIVMTGLDQDMMQKNLTCKTLREAQKDLCTYGFAFVPANMLFLSLGVLLALLFARQGLDLPVSGDALLPQFVESVSNGTLDTGGNVSALFSRSSLILVLFALGIVASSFSSADSALTALTTCWCVDICGRPEDERLRRRSHVGITIVFAVVILLVDAFNSTSVIDAIYILCSYTYGPLLGLFAYALIGRERKMRNEHLSPYIAVASPVVCLIIAKTVEALTGYRFGYEMLLLNGLLTLTALAAVDHLPTVRH